MFALLLLTAAQPPGPPPVPGPVVSLPAAVDAPVGRIVKLTAETSGKSVRWALATDGADLVPFPDGKLAVFAAAKPGKYLVLAWTAAGDVPGEAARCVITVGDAPAGGLAAELQAAFAADTAAEKATHAAKLAALYREAVPLCEKADVLTAGDLAGRVRAAAAVRLPAGALPAVRKRIADELAKSLPADAEQPLTASVRKAAAESFSSVAAALEGLK